MAPAQGTWGELLGEVRDSTAAERTKTGAWDALDEAIPPRVGSPVWGDVVRTVATVTQGVFLIESTNNLWRWTNDRQRHWRSSCKSLGQSQDIYCIYILHIHVMN